MVVSMIEGVIPMKSFKALRRAIALVLVVMTLACSMPAFAASPKGSYYCTGNGVNVREYPYSSAASLYKLQKGDVVTYMSQSNGWYRVRYYDKKANVSGYGYVYRKYLTSVTSKSSSSSSSSVKTGATYRTTVNLRVRSKPSMDEGYVKTKLKKGTKVKVSKQSKSWVYITYKGGSGWVSAKYIKKVS